MSEQESLEELLAVGQAAVVDAAFCTGNFAGAERMLQAVREGAEAQGDRAVLAAALDALGFLQHWKNLEWRLVGERGDDLPPEDVATELALFEQALALRQALGDAGGVAESLFHVGLVYQLFRGDWDTALTYFEQARSGARVAGDDLLLSEAYRHIGFFFLVQAGDIEQALGYLEQSLALRERLSFPGWLVSGLLTLGQIEAQAGRWAAAVAHLRRGVRLAEEIGMREWWTRQARVALQQAEAAMPE